MGAKSCSSSSLSSILGTSSPSSSDMSCCLFAVPLRCCTRLSLALMPSASSSSTRERCMPALRFEYGPTVAAPLIASLDIGAGRGTDIVLVRREGPLSFTVAVAVFEGPLRASPNGVRMLSRTLNIRSASLRGAGLGGSRARSSSIEINPCSGSQVICFFLADPLTTDPISLALSSRSKLDRPKASAASRLPNLMLRGVSARLVAPTDGAAAAAAAAARRLLEAKSLSSSSPSEALD